MVDQIQFTVLEPKLLIDHKLRCLSFYHGGNVGTPKHHHLLWVLYPISRTTLRPEKLLNAFPCL
jgi:hypothetical protein